MCTTFISGLVRHGPKRILRRHRVTRSAAKLMRRGADRKAILSFRRTRPHTIVATATTKTTPPTENRREQNKRKSETFCRYLFQ